MPHVVVDQVLRETTIGVIFSGLTPDGDRLIVRLSERIFPVPGDVLEVDGEVSTWVDERGIEHRQLDADRADRVRTSGRLLGPWLQSLPGIGPERAKRLLHRFGPDLLEVLGDSDQAEALAEAISPGRKALGEKLAGVLLARFAEMQAAEDAAISEALFYGRLEEIGVDNRRAAKLVYRLLGSVDAWDKLLRHPYMPAAVLGWREADHLGLRLLAFRGDDVEPEHHEDRLIGACDGAWRRLLAAGHTAASRSDFKILLQQAGVDTERALMLGIAARRVVEHDDLVRAPGGVWLERQVAKEVRRLQGESLADGAAGSPGLRQQTGDLLTKQQFAAVKASLCRNFSLLQGSAGSGKTTTLRAVVEEHERRGGNAVLTALSGKAALRLSRATSRRAYTIARLLHSLAWNRNLVEKGRPIPADAPNLAANSMLIIDEASMVDLVSWQKLLSEVPTGASVLLVGDTNQLPPVGLGRVFHDLVEVGSNVNRLTQVMRQAEDSPIIAAASAMREGRIPIVPVYSGVKRGVFLMPCPPKAIDKAVLRVRDELVADGAASDDILVLAALRTSCDAVNSRMQLRRQDEGKVGKRLGPLAAFVAVGDPIICTRNRYDEALMNGGWLASIDPLLILFDGEDTPRQISPEAVLELKSAWAITCHRAQGSEARRVIVALDGARLLTREWLYTAVTRATEQVVLVGPSNAIARAVGNRAERSSGFRQDLAATQ